MDEYSSESITVLATIEHVRRRPGMYVGGTGLFGLIHYFVAPVVLLLSHRPTRITVEVSKSGFTIESDAEVLTAVTEGRIIPFEEYMVTERGHGLEGVVLTALSKTLSIEIRRATSSERLTFRRGVKESHRTISRKNRKTGTVLRFAPDRSILGVSSVSPSILQSYFRRLSYLHSGVRFGLRVEGNSEEFFHENGIIDLFNAVSAPYQLLHEPIQVTATEGKLDLECVFAYQSWYGNHLCCFINNGRAVQGGSHEDGFTKALDQLYRQLKLPKRRKPSRNGVIGVLSVRYPGVTWEGCIKVKVNNPELQEMVSRLVVKHATEWMESHPDVAEQLPNLETFTFPASWSL